MLYERDTFVDFLQYLLTIIPEDQSGVSYKHRKVINLAIADPGRKNSRRLDLYRQERINPSNELLAVAKMDQTARALIVIGLYSGPAEFGANLTFSALRLHQWEHDPRDYWSQVRAKVAYNGEVQAAVGGAENVVALSLVAYLRDCRIDGKKAQALVVAQPKRVIIDDRFAFELHPGRTIHGSVRKLA